MNKSFDFPSGILTVAKSRRKNQHTLKISFGSISIAVGYNYETVRDRAFKDFDYRNALAVYNGMLNMTEEF